MGTEPSSGAFNGRPLLSEVTEVAGFSAVPGRRLLWRNAKSCGLREDLSCSCASAISSRVIVSSFLIRKETVVNQSSSVADP
jgi:hypothetical protein